MRKQGQVAAFLTTLAILLFSKAAFGQGWPHWLWPEAKSSSVLTNTCTRSVRVRRRTFQPRPARGNLPKD
jgi:hypothetical protein